MTRVEFFATGTAKPKGSAQAFVGSKSGKAHLRGGSAGEHSWRAVVGARASEAMAGAPPIEGAVSVLLVAYSQRPRGHYGSGKNAAKLKESAPRLPTAAPDADKIARSVLDALNGVVFRDDALVATLQVRKRFTNEAFPYVGVQVCVWAEGELGYEAQP